MLVFRPQSVPVTSFPNRYSRTSFTRRYICPSYWQCRQITYTKINTNVKSRNLNVKGKGKAVPLQVWSGPEGSRKLRFPDSMTTAQDGGKVVSLIHRPPLPPGNTPGTHFCYRLSRSQGRSATGRIVTEKFHLYHRE